MSVAALIVAAGRGSRAGGGVPKQYRALAGRPSSFTRSRSSSTPRRRLRPAGDPPGRSGAVRRRLPRLQTPAGKLLPPVHGGATRQDRSVAVWRRWPTSPPISSSSTMPPGPSPSGALIDRAIAARRAHGAAVPGIARHRHDQGGGRSRQVVDTPDRARLRAVQTPQAFRFRCLLDAHRRARRRTVTASPTTARSPNGPACRCRCSRATRQREAHPAADFAEAERRSAGRADLDDPRRHRLRRACLRRGRPRLARRRARSRTTAASSPIPTATWSCTP